MHVQTRLCDKSETSPNATKHLIEKRRVSLLICHPFFVYCAVHSCYLVDKMSTGGKMSLVVLRSWSDGPPKIRAIAPPDDDRAEYVPDHQGRFVTEESKEDPTIIVADGLLENSPFRCASSASQYKEVQGRNINATGGMMPVASYKKTVDGVVYRKSPLQRCFAIAHPGVLSSGISANRHSYTGAGASSAGLVGSIPPIKATPHSLTLSLHATNSSEKESISSSRPDSATSPGE